MDFRNQTYVHKVVRRSFENGVYSIYREDYTPIEWAVLSEYDDIVHYKGMEFEMHHSDDVITFKTTDVANNSDDDVMESDEEYEASFVSIVSDRSDNTYVNVSETTSDAEYEDPEKTDEVSFGMHVDKVCSRMVDACCEMYTCYEKEASLTSDSDEYESESDYDEESPLIKKEEYKKTVSFSDIESVISDYSF